MAHFAQIDSNNIVTKVLVVPDDQEHRGQEFLAEDLKLGGVWVKTSYNTRRGVHKKNGTPFRKNYAGIGFSYDSIRDAFIPPKPYPSWLLDEETCNWYPPVQPPSEPPPSGMYYKWDESTVSWITVAKNP